MVNVYLKVRILSKVLLLTLIKPSLPPCIPECYTIKIYISTLLCRASVSCNKKALKDSMAFIKPFKLPQRIIKIKI